MNTLTTNDFESDISYMDAEAYELNMLSAWERRIINLTQHPATPEQIKAGVEDLPDEWREEVVALLTFSSIPNIDEIKTRADKLAFIASWYGAKAMIGGAPYLMGALETALKKEKIKPVYVFSKRESVEETLPDGKVIKKSIFKHAGFVEV